MSNENPTLQDIWRLLGSMNKRFGDRFDGLEHQIVHMKNDIARIREEVFGLRAHFTGAISALKESIEARDFRLDDHGRRLTDLEQRVDERSR